MMKIQTVRFEHKLSAILTIFVLVLFVVVANAAGTFSGKGDDVTKAFELHEGVAIFEFEHDGSSNFIVLLYSAETGEREDLLANEVGRYQGKTIVAVQDSSYSTIKSGKYQLDVQADGNWRMTFEQPKEVSGESLPQSFKGSRDDVVGPIELKRGSVKFDCTHEGYSNFIIGLYESNGKDRELIVNEIGPYTGKQLEEIGTSDSYFISIVGEGWTIKLTQEVTLDPTPINIPTPSQPLSQYQHQK